MTNSRFMTFVRGVPAYLKKFLNEILEKFKQLCVPTFLLILCFADKRWRIKNGGWRMKDGGWRLINL